MRRFFKIHAFFHKNNKESLMETSKNRGRKHHIPAFSLDWETATAAKKMRHRLRWVCAAWINGSQI